jgi:hypothetical protein
VRSRGSAGRRIWRPDHSNLQCRGAISCYNIAMSHVTLRTDAEVERMLARLTEGGLSRSEVLRNALLAFYHERIRAEADAAAADPNDLAEAMAIQADLEPLRAW